MSLRSNGTNHDSRCALIAAVFMAFIGALLIFLFPGSPEQDGDYHFLMARTAWVDHFYFVDVWGRPLFTTLFAPVAALGFIPARFFALAISLAAAWQTYRLVLGWSRRFYLVNRRSSNFTQICSPRRCLLWFW